MILGIAAFSYPVNLLLDNYKVIVLWGFAGAMNQEGALDLYKTKK